MQSAQDRLQDLPRPDLVRFRKEERELVPADPSREVRRSNSGAERRGDRPEHLVPDGSSEFVIDGLEVVEVYAGKGQRTTPAACARHLQGRPFAEGVSVREPSQGVGSREVLFTLEPLAQLGHQERHDEEARQVRATVPDEDEQPRAVQSREGVRDQRSRG